MKTKGQDVETLILKGIFICLEPWFIPKVEIFGYLGKKLSYFEKLIIQNTNATIYAQSN